MRVIINCIIRDLVAAAIVCLFFWLRWYIIPAIPIINLLDFPLIFLWYYFSILWFMSIASVDIISTIIGVLVSIIHLYFCLLSLQYYSSLFGNILVYAGIILGVCQTIVIVKNNYSNYRFNPLAQENSD